MTQEDLVLDQHFSFISVRSERSYALCCDLILCSRFLRLWLKCDQHLSSRDTVLERKEKVSKRAWRAPLLHLILAWVFFKENPFSGIDLYWFYHKTITSQCHFCGGHHKTHHWHYWSWSPISWGKMLQSYDLPNNTQQDRSARSFRQAATAYTRRFLLLDMIYFHMDFDI